MDLLAMSHALVKISFASQTCWCAFFTLWAHASSTLFSLTWSSFLFLLRSCSSWALFAFELLGSSKPESNKSPRAFRFCLSSSCSWALCRWADSKFLAMLSYSFLNALESFLSVCPMSVDMIADKGDVGGKAGERLYQKKRRIYSPMVQVQVPSRRNYLNDQKYKWRSLGGGGSGQEYSFENTKLLENEERERDDIIARRNEAIDNWYLE